MPFIERYFSDSFFAQTLGLVLMLVALDTALPASGAMKFPGKNPGRTEAARLGQEYRLGNQILAVTWRSQAGALRPGTLTDKLAHQTLPLGDELFRIVLSDGRVIDASTFKIEKGPVIQRVKADPASPRWGDHFTGTRIAATLSDAASGLRVDWSALLRAEANTVRQQIEVKAVKTDLPIASVVLLDLELPQGRVSGRVPGSPIVTDTLFMGLENPMSSSTLERGRATCALEVGVPLRKGRAITWSSVLGVAPRGQLRRAVLYYVERERAHPYRTFLHYNTWYDIGYFSKYSEADALACINAYGRELVQKRGVTMDSLLFDDGWDETSTLWNFHKDFPNGFAPLREAAAGYGMGLGVWMSPFGGYGKPRQQRLAAGKEAGYEINQSGFALSGAKYFEYFRATALKFVHDYGVNMFKFDGLSRNTAAPAGSPFSSDFQAAIQLIEDLRAVRRDIFINLTTGTWPSPFWTLLADSIWRDGEDHDFAGVGSWRQKWITYRDEQTWRNVVQGGPLYPISSLMLHGIIYAKHAKNLNTDPGNDLRDEIRCAFGEGTQLQELYITPGLMSGKNWDDLAAAANWARKNAAVLQDTHWIGGDPGKLEVYGWASWAEGKGILTLRNPSDKEQSFEGDAQSAFELPAGAAAKFAMKTPYEDQRIKTMELTGGEKMKVTLKPFEVLVFEGVGEK